ncbi:MAG: hypothetical protein MK291_12245, partial [Planctomycetes bacterium]|nr:hypothetical protein [Planctomycetota bacterium]
KDLRWQLGRIAGVMIPFAIAIYYAQHVELGDNFLLIASVSTLLAGAATYVGRRLELAGLSLAASAAAAAVSSTWLFSRTLDESALITFAVLTGAASLIIALVDARSRREEPGELHPAAVHSLVLLFSLAFTVSFLSSELSLWGVLLALGVHLSVSIGTRASLPALPALAGIATGFTLLLYRVQHIHPGNPNFHSASALLFGVIAFSGALLVASIRWQSHPSPRALALSALLAAAPSLLYLDRDWYGATPLTFYGVVALIALIATWSAARTTSSIAYGAAVLLISWALYAGVDPGFYESREWSITAILPWLYLGTAIATLAPLLAKEQLKETYAVGLTASLAPALAAAPLLALHEHQLGERGALLVFLALAALPALAYKLLADDDQDADRSETSGVKRARTSYLLIASGLLAFAIPAELRNFHMELLARETTLWLIPALALAAAAASFVARSRESAAANTAAHLAFLFAGVSLCIITFDLDDLHRQESYLFNWLSYLYGVGLVSGLYVMRNTSAKADADEDSRRYLVACTGGFTCLLGFAWLNLLLINGYSDGERLDISSSDLNRDLVLSLSWTLYSFSLLA